MVLAVEAHDTVYDDILHEHILDYSNGYYGDEKCKDIVKEACLTTRPTILDLRGNRIEANGAKILATELLRYPKKHQIVSILLEWNNIGLLDEGIYHLAQSLKIDTKLIKLDLKNNNITPDGAKRLAGALSFNGSLRVLDLRWNEIGNIGAQAFKEVLEVDNQTLIKLDITGNNCDARHAEDIESLLMRNRRKHQRLSDSHPGEEEPASRSHEKKLDEDDELLLQLLAEKEQLQHTLQSMQKKEISHAGAIESLEANIVSLKRNEIILRNQKDQLKEEKDSIMQGMKDLRSQLEESNKRKELEAEEFRLIKNNLEHEKSILKKQLQKAESTHRSDLSAKELLIRKVEESTQNIEDELQSSQEKLRIQEEKAAELVEALEITKRSNAKRELDHKLQRKNELDLINRLHAQEVRGLNEELLSCRSELKDQRLSILKTEAMLKEVQDDIVHTKVRHEKELEALKIKADKDIQDQVERAVTSAKIKLLEIERSLKAMQAESSQHAATSAKLWKQHAAAEESFAQQRSAYMQQISELEKRVLKQQETQDKTHLERLVLEEKLEDQVRRTVSMDATIANMQSNFERQIQQQTKANHTKHQAIDAELNETRLLITRLEVKITSLEEALLQQEFANRGHLATFIRQVRDFIDEQEATICSRSSFSAPNQPTAEDRISEH